MIVTDSTPLEAGIKDFIFVCKKQPFAITCSPYLPKIPENYVDLDLVLKLNIPMKNLECTRISYAGQFTRVVGQISQTVQCVVSGKTIGTSHLKAKVVRDLNKLFNTDCIASKQLYDKLMDSSFNTRKENNMRANNKRLETKNRGTNDVYTNVSTVLVNTCGTPTSSHMDEDRVNVGTPFSNASFMDEECFLRDEPDRYSITSSTADLVENIAKYKTADYDRSLGYYGAIKTIPGYCSSSVNEVNPSRTFQAPSGFSTSPASAPDNPASTPSPTLPYSSLDPVLAAIAKQGIRPTDAYICSINTSTNQDHMKFPMPAVIHPSRQAMEKHTPSGLCSPFNYISDLGNDPSVQQPSQAPSVRPDVSLAELEAQHGYYDEDTNHAATDQVSLHSDTAEFHCRLCSMKNQPTAVTFSHNLLDPFCPSMETDEEDNLEDDECFEE